MYSYVHMGLYIKTKCNPAGETSHNTGRLQHKCVKTLIMIIEHKIDALAARQ